MKKIGGADGRENEEKDDEEDGVKRGGQAAHIFRWRHYRYRSIRLLTPDAKELKQLN